MFTDTPNVPLVAIQEDFIQSKGANLFLLREDLIHPTISGNKWRKLKYNIEEARKQGMDKLLTFGGAYSNHIAAAAYAGKLAGLKTIGVIRGDQHQELNTTLFEAKKNGMSLKFVLRESYRKKYEASFLEELKAEWGDFYMLPEGGTNVLAVKGCAEILSSINNSFDMVCCACGTGGTLAGIIASMDSNQKALGFPVLKGGDFLKKDVEHLLKQYANKYMVPPLMGSWELCVKYHFGGYAKVTAELIEFVQRFYQKHDIALDLIYTGKLFYGIYDLIRNTSQLDGKTVLAIHTGGLQGNKGMEERLGIQLF